MLATLTFGVYGAAFSTAFGNQAADATNVRGDVVGDATYVREMHWHQLKGVRAKVACRFLNDRSELVKLCILAVASEPFRMLMRIFFVYSQSNPSAPGSGDAQRASPPPLTNFTSDALSPIISLLQYVSSFLSGDGSRSRRLWLLLGVLKLSDLKSFWRSHRNVALAMRMSMHIVGGQIFLRHALRFKAYPWKFGCLVDDRLSLENRFSIGDHFLAVPLCCLD